MRDAICCRNFVDTVTDANDFADAPPQYPSRRRVGHAGFHPYPPYLPPRWNESRIHIAWTSTRSTSQSEFATPAHLCQHLLSHGTRFGDHSGESCAKLFGGTADGEPGVVVKVLCNGTLNVCGLAHIKAAAPLDVCRAGRAAGVALSTRTSVWSLSATERRVHRHGGRWEERVPHFSSVPWAVLGSNWVRTLSRQWASQATR